MGYHQDSPDPNGQYNKGKFQQLAKLRRVRVTR
jgi:hypothetical protein